MSGKEELGPIGPIEESLRRSFAPPDLSKLETKIDAACASVSTPVVDELAARRRKLLVTAGAVVAAALAVSIWWARRDPSPEKGEVVAASPRQEFGANLAMYVSDRKLPSAGDMSCVAAPKPPEGCVDDNLKPSLPATDRIEVLGECGMSGGPNCKHSSLLASAGLQLRIRPAGRQFFVCMDLLAQDPRPLLPTGSDLRLFRRELGDYVIYEVTPLSEPHALKLFMLPAQ